MRKPTRFAQIFTSEGTPLGVSSLYRGDNLESAPLQNLIERPDHSR